MRVTTVPIYRFIFCRQDTGSHSCCRLLPDGLGIRQPGNVSGTTPAVVIYYWGWISGLLVRLLVTCKYCSLPNLMVDRMVLPEFFPQGDGALAIKQVTGNFLPG